MKIVHAICAVLMLFTLFAGHAQAAGTLLRWSDGTLHLGLTYPGNWRVVKERGAILKLVAPDAAGEFEIFVLPAPLSPVGLTAQTENALTRLHCAVAVQHATGVVGHLKVSGKVASGSCTGGDRGWRLTVTAFNLGPQAILLRSWLFHKPMLDTTALAAITSSLHGVNS